MKIYIKDYLKKIPIIDKLCNMVIEYNKVEYPENTSFREFNKQMVDNDIVKFLEYVLPTEEVLKKFLPKLNIEELVEFRKNQITYLSQLFYSVKGTYKVLDYLTEYDLFQTIFNTKNTNNYGKYRDVETVINYTTQGIEIKIKSLPSFLDRDLFCEYLEKFLSNLLYFETLTISIDEISLEFNDSTVTSVNRGDELFQFYEAVE